MICEVVAGWIHHAIVCLNKGPFSLTSNSHKSKQQYPMLWITSNKQKYPQRKHSNKQIEIKALKQKRLKSNNFSAGQIQINPPVFGDEPFLSYEWTHGELMFKKIFANAESSLTSPQRPKRSSQLIFSEHEKSMKELLQRSLLVTVNIDGGQETNLDPPSGTQETEQRTSTKWHHSHVRLYRKK